MKGNEKGPDNIMERGRGSWLYIMEKEDSVTVERKGEGHSQCWRGGGKGRWNTTVSG